MLERHRTVRLSPDLGYPCGGGDWSLMGFLEVGKTAECFVTPLCLRQRGQGLKLRSRCDLFLCNTSSAVTFPVPQDDWVDVSWNVVGSHLFPHIFSGQIFPLSLQCSPLYPCHLIPMPFQLLSLINFLTLLTFLLGTHYHVVQGNGILCFGLLPLTNTNNIPMHILKQLCSLP